MLKVNWLKVSPLAVGAAALLATGSAGAALYGFGPAEAWTIEEIASLVEDVTENITDFGTSFGENMANKFEDLISAIAVATKQEALSGSVVSDAVHDAAQQLVTAVGTQRENSQVATTYLEYNPATGQGYQPCLVNAQNRTLDAAFDALGTSAQASVATLDVAPGRMVASVGAAMSQRLANHREYFCSEAEATAGLCTLSTLPGGDTNGALLFASTAAGSLQAQAQQAYMQHVLGSPDQSIPATAGATPAGQNYMLLKNSKDALLSVPAYSLSMIQAANTQTTDLGGKSPNDVLTVRVNQYFGGKEAQAWSNVLAAQSERGLMVEAVKMDGLQAWLHHKQYQQNQRLELNLAALALAASQQAKATTDDKYARMIRDNAAGAIK